MGPLGAGWVVGTLLPVLTRVPRSPAVRRVADCRLCAVRAALTHRVVPAVPAGDGHAAAGPVPALLQSRGDGSRLG